MKTTIKLISAALMLAVFTTLGCQNDLSVTSMNQDDVKKAFDFESYLAATTNPPTDGEDFLPAEFQLANNGGNPSTISSPLGFSGALDLSTNPAKTEIVLTFPTDRYLDVLAIPNDIDGSGKVTYGTFQTELKTFLNFYSLQDKPAADQSKAHVPQPHAALNWEVSQRDGSAVTIKFTNLTTTMYPVIEAEILCENFTYANKHTIDFDGNGKPGEKWFDDWYGYIGIVGATGSLAGTLGERNPRAGLDLATSFIVDVLDGAGTVQVGSSITTDEGILDPGTTGINLQITHSATFGTDETDGNYAENLKSRFVLERYNRSSQQWESKNDLLAAFAKSTLGPVTYTAKITAQSQDLFRINYIVKQDDEGELTTIGNFYGGKQRYYETNANMKNAVIAQQFTFAVLAAASYQEISTTGTIDTAVYYADADGRNGYVTIDFNSTVTGGLGVILPSTSDFAKHFKLYYNAETRNPATYDALYVCVPIKTVVQLDVFRIKIILDPEFRKNSSNVYGTGQTIPYTILINNGLKGSVLAGSPQLYFGDILSTTVYEGESGFVKYDPTGGDLR